MPLTWRATITRNTVKVLEEIHQAVQARDQMIDQSLNHGRARESVRMASSFQEENIDKQTRSCWARNRRRM